MKITKSNAGYVKHRYIITLDRRVGYISEYIDNIYGYKHRIWTLHLGGTDIMLFKKT